MDFLGLLLNAFVGALICTRYFFSYLLVLLMLMTFKPVGQLLVTLGRYVWVSPGKWLRFLKEENSLWYSVVKRKWGGLEERGWGWLGFWFGFIPL